MLDSLAQHFKHFAQQARGESPLYERLSLRVSRDPEILELASKASRGQPAANLLFAAGHYLLFKGIQHPLADFYPSVSGTASPGEDPFPHFKDFCTRYRADIENLLETRLVQTNVVERCSYLFLVFGLISQRVGPKPLAIVEVGAAAGLNLNLDLYSYDYGDGKQYGALDSPVSIYNPCSGGNGALRYPRASPVWISSWG